NHAAGRGGAVLVALGDVTVSHSILSFNSAANGGAIDDDVGNVSIRNGSSLHDNTTKGEGGAVFDLGTLTLVGSSVSNNHSGIGGGGLSATKAVLTNSTVSGNSTDGFGGGLSAVNVALTNATVSGNTASGDGGGIFVTKDGDILNCTIVLNHAGRFGGGVDADGGAVSVKN